MLKIYKASAGSGKTFKLTREYIKMLLGVQDEGKWSLNRHLLSGIGEGHKRILAITFTNKATEEMKSRIVSELSILAGKVPDKTSPFTKDYIAEFGCSEEDLGKAAFNALRGLLLDYQWFAVSTIDSFFQQVLRAFAREVGLHGGYNIELDNKLVYSQAIDALLSDLDNDTLTDPGHGDKGVIAKWVEQLMNDKAEGGTQFNVFDRNSSVYSDLVTFVADITGEVFDQNRDQLMAFLGDVAKIGEFGKTLRKRQAQLRKNASALCASALEKIEPVEKDVDGNLLKALKKWTDPNSYIKDLSKMFGKAVNDIEEAYNKGLKNQPRPDGLDEIIRAASKAAITAHGEGNFLLLVVSNLYNMGLLGQILLNVERLRKEGDMILLSDSGEMLRGIMGHGKDDAPFVYERIGVRYSHYLIDEFQDTSQVQWFNLKPLVWESMSNSHDNLIIGDVKQAIYRFRNSDPWVLQYMHLDKDLERYDAIETRGTSAEDNTNWRSSRDVVQFNNTLYTHLARLMGFGSEYEGVAQEVSETHANHRGYVRVELTEKPPSQKQRQTEGEEEQAAPETALALLARQIKRQLQAGYLPCDIAVLVRWNKEGVQVSDYLINLRGQDPAFDNIKIATDDSLLLAQAPAVRLVVSVLRYLALGLGNAESPASKARRQLARLHNAYEYLLSTSGATPSEALPLAVQAAEDPAGVAREVAASVLDMECSNLVSIVERIINRYVPQKDRDTQNVFISAFQDAVRDFAARGASDIVSFLNWWDMKSEKIYVAAAPDPDAINVMTIHKAKGLQFSCVHVPFADFKHCVKEPIEWFNVSKLFPYFADAPVMLPLKMTSAFDASPIAAQYRQKMRDYEMDTLNLLYVATTRAVDELCVTLPQQPAKSGAVGANILAAIGAAGWKFDGDNVLEFGAPTSPEKEKEGEKKEKQPQPTPLMPPYTGHDRDDLWDSTRLETLADTDGVLERGIVLHTLMSSVAGRGDVRRAVDAMVNAGELPHGEGEVYHDLLQRALADPRVSRWFDGTRRVMLEREIVDTDGSIHRPDRVVWTGDGGVEVIDYKFGQRSPKHAPQVRRYMRLLERAGCAPVKGYVWYPAEGWIDEVRP